MITALTTASRILSKEPSTERSPHLSIRVACSKENSDTSFVAYQYATYPFRLSSNLRLDPTDPQRVYAYIMSAAPGILSGDDLRLHVEVGDRASLYLTDQSATKVYSKPTGGESAQVEWTINVGAGAYCEYVPEPIILFNAAMLTQRMQVILHPQGQLVLSEIIVPGRIARGEFYDFERYQSRLRVQRPTGEVCFADNLRLLGKTNRFKHSPLLSECPLMGNFIVVVPGVDLTQLVRAFESFSLLEDGLEDGPDRLQACSSRLPGCQGLLVRAIATQVSDLKAYQHHLLNCVRQLTGQVPLPPIPK